MKDLEKAENVLNASQMINDLLDALKMKAPTFANQIGINYQRVFDLQRGRVKKFNPGVIKLICEKFPQVSASWLATGSGPMFVGGYETSAAQEQMPDLFSQAEETDNPTSNVSPSAPAVTFNDAVSKIADMYLKLLEQEKEYQKKLETLHAREIKVREDEIEILKKELSLLKGGEGISNAV